MITDAESPPVANVAGPEGLRGSLRGTVHVIDDDAAVRQAISLLLRSLRLSVVTYPSGLAFLDALPGLDVGDVDCVLTDLRMPDLDGIALLHRLREAGFRRPVVVMTAHGDIATAVRAMKAGAVEFIEKPFDDDALIAVLQTACAGAPDQAMPGGGHRETPLEIAAAARRIADLSPREREVLDLLVAGKPNKLVAFELGISQRTAEVHRARMMARLGVRSLAEAVRLAVQAELLRGGDRAPALPDDPGPA